MWVTTSALSALFVVAGASDTSDDISLIHSGKAFWLCVAGIEGVACGSRREPAMNAQGLYCGDGLCCPSTRTSNPLICTKEPCSSTFLQVPDSCSCKEFESMCSTSEGASHCLELSQSGRLSGVACVYVCADNACGPADAVKFCYPSKLVTNPSHQTKYEATCICEKNYVFNAGTHKCLPAPYDRCAREAPCGPVEGVNTCREHPITGKFICTCRTGYVLNRRDNKCQEKCSDEEAALCGPAEAHDAEHCSMGLGGRICACKDGFKWDLQLRTCVEEDCYSPAFGWQEGVKTCVKQGEQRTYTCAEGFQMNASRECLPECMPGWRYNRNREMCELSTTTCSLSECGATEAVEACLVDKDSGKHICKCKAGYALHTETGMCASLPACQADTCKIFGADAVCVSDGSDAYSCECISEIKTVGDETTHVVKACDPVECSDPSICGKGDSIMECIQGASAHECFCSPRYTMNGNTGMCTPLDEMFLLKSYVPVGSARVSATRAPMHFIINAAPCLSAEFNASSRTFDVKTYHKAGETRTTSVTLPYHSGSHTGTAFTYRMSPAPGGFDISLVYELRPSRFKQVMEQTSFRVFTNPLAWKVAQELGGGVDAAVAALMASAGESPCEVVSVKVAAMADDKRFENLTVLFEKLPTAEANAPSTATGFPEVKPGLSETVTVAFPSPSGEYEVPPEPEADKVLQYPKPTDPLPPEEVAPETQGSIDSE
ncbi:uncharacterized protein EMH_0013360 [Eimeria mitis]|uniref:EGF-like domain-containing protein n=1 Tax=Eimeria mitis TaxID=44415 RepID=U6JRQ1_9EIME|nr:uncharacterized protein EMH_0013360 [Eimeria mitis]CDJ28140.1 hypothetical protein, conserved [Eimeria mitis]